MDARQPQQWVLRRIGPPPSIPEVADVAELKRGSTVFGRGPTADVFIDSRILKNFISRRHAVVVGEVGDDSQLHFTLYNHGLNGTYVNDVRVGEVHQLNEGDRVTFGHKNGVNVKVGETALQADSEFQYVLELAPLPRQPVVPVGEPVPPLGERLCQESNPSVTCLSEYDRSECHFFSPKISHAVSPDAQQEPSFSPSNKLKSSQPKPLFEVPSRSLQSKHSEGGASRSPRGGKTETIGAAKVETVSDTKKAAFVESNSPGLAHVGSRGSRLPARRHSDDSVIKSTASNKDSDAVFSGSKTAAPEPSSPRQRPSGSCRPVPDTSRSPRPVRDRSRSPVSRRERSKSPRPVCSSSVSPVSPVSQRITRSRSRSPAPTHLLAGPKAKDPTPKEQETLLSGYDDPPVLTPESIARTPSPSYISQNEVDDEDFGENDIESDRESIGWEIPPTPGRSLGEASPYPHGHMTPHRRTIVPANAVYRSATHAAPKTVNRRSSTSGDETDFGGERQVGRSHLEKADCSGDRTGKEHTASAESKRTGVTSLFSEIQRTATSSSPARSKERGGAEPKAKVRRKSKDFVNDLSDNDDVFDNPSSSNHSSSRHSHGMGTGSESRRKIPKSSTEVSRTSHKPNKSLLEKENGFAEGHASKHPVGSVRSKDRRAARDKQLLDVRVTVERVSAEDYSKNKFKNNPAVTLKNRSQDLTPAPGKPRTQTPKDAPSSRENRMEQAGDRNMQKKPSAEGEPLFGREKDKIQKSTAAKPTSWALPGKGRAQVSRGRTVVSKEKGGVDYSGDWLMKEIEKGKQAVFRDKSQHRKTRDRSKEVVKDKGVSEKSKEKSKDRKSSVEIHETRAGRQGTHKEPILSGDERENPRQVRKIAMRRPRMPKISEDKKDSQKPSGPENKPARKRRRRRKKKEEDDDDDDDDDDLNDEEGGEEETLEDGVVWYEEECCDSDVCSRPKNRRVEWVQCDDCDKWYHTVCVGCNLAEVKDEDFHCGCV